jgi:glycosyltransferase involved in cell wall biosynthesis
VIAGFFSPLPPARTGVADYAAALLEELRRHGRVEVAPPRCDVALCHLGNNGLHAAAYRRALEPDTVVVLHDAVLHHFLLGQLDEEPYIEEFVYNYGEWNRGLARDLWRGRAASGADSRYFGYPMLRRVVERARAVVVHNPAAERMVREQVPTARVFEIPHLFRPPALPGEAEAARYRQTLGVPQDAFLFGVFGYLRESKRLTTVLDVFPEVRRGNPRAFLLVAGRFVSPDLERAVSGLLDAEGVIRRPFLSDREFWLAARAVDACINLRYPTAGETSGIGIRLMGIGKPVLVTDSAEYQRIPEDACLRVPPGPAEREGLRAHLILLTSVFGSAHAIGQRGAGHIAACHRVDQIGRRYWEVLCECCT